MSNKELERYYNQIQLNLIDKVVLKDSFKKEELNKISGVDLAYWNENGMEYAVCSIVTIDCSSREIIEVRSLYDKINVPYIPGYLSFRELPLIINTYKLLNHNTDLIIFDGNGYLHYRNMGIATHASFYLKKPTIGVAKSYLKIENTNYIMPKDEEGAYTDIIVNEKIYGRVLRTHTGVKPIFVSCGNWISLNTATNIVFSLVDKNSRQPLPTRLADIETKKQRGCILKALQG